MERGTSLNSCCIFNSGIGDMLFSSNAGRVGGSEIQHCYLARELLQRDYRLDIITFTRKGPEKTRSPLSIRRKGINFWLIPISGSGKCGILQFFRTIIMIFSLVRRINPDFIMQRGAGYETGLFCLVCTFYRKKFVYNIASLNDLTGSQEPLRLKLKRIVSDFGISHADIVIAQTEEQRRIVHTRWGKKCTVIKNIYPVDCRKQARDVPPVILWTGTIRPEWKQPELFLRLAQEIPEARFLMVGGPSRDIEFYHEIKHESKIIPNLDFIGFVPYKEVGAYFSRASILVNTSSVEGFPNTFIEAWLSGMPVVSLLVDPDEIICRYKLGFHSGTFDQLVKDVRTLINNSGLREEMGKNGRVYVEREHDIRKNVDMLISSLSEDM